MSQVSQADIILIQTPTWLQEVFQGGSPFGPQRGGGQASRGGRQPGGRIPNPLPGSSSPDTICRQRPNSCTMFTLSKFNKYSGQRGVVPLKGTLQEVRVKVAGRLALFHNNWLKVTHDQWVLETVQGYRLEFLREPVQTESCRHLSSRVSFKRRFKICCGKKP